jgi:hypothetical protein
MGEFPRHHDIGECFSQNFRNNPNPLQFEYFRDEINCICLNIISLLIHGISEQCSVFVFQEVTGYPD